MKISNFYLLSFAAFFPLLAHSYYEQLDYKTDIKEHKNEFILHAPGNLIDQYSRILLTMSCDDSDYIPKHPDAGKVFDHGQIPYQIMHNGIKVLKDGYCGAWVTDLIYGLQGHHEPQEEKVFYEVLKHISPKAVMIELGGYWGYYSLWFAKEIPESKNYIVEPVPNRLNLGKTNFALNNLHASFFQAYVGDSSTDDPAEFEGCPQITIDSFLSKNNIQHVNILHSDIQGAEYEMLLSAINSIAQAKIDYFFISTHSEDIHKNCMKFLKSHNYIIIAEHSPKQSYSFDGLVVARRNGVFGPDNIKISKRF